MGETALKNLGPLRCFLVPRGVAVIAMALRFKRAGDKSRLGSRRPGRPATAVARARGAT